MTAAEPVLVVVVGPTAVGKTELAVALARAVDGEIVGADSRQVYRRMDIGTAKPTAREQAAATHHLVDVVDPDEDFDVGAFSVAAARAIDDIRARGRLPILVGGSGFYVNALLEGLPELPTPDPARRAALQQRARDEGAPALHAELAEVDPPTAARLHPNDAVRIVRALEVHAATGRPLSSYERVPRFTGRVVRLLVDRPREEMAERIRARTHAMWAAGLPDEVEGLLAAGYAPELKSMDALGYRETAQFLAGAASREETLERIEIRTRQLVRKQRAWFRSPPGELPLHPDRDAVAIRVALERARAGAA